MWCSKGRDISIETGRRCYRFLLQIEDLWRRLGGLAARCEKSTMAPSSQAEDVVSGVRKGVRAILLGPPGAGKGTQVRLHTLVS